MERVSQGSEREKIERELEEHATEDERQRRGSTPSEDVMKRAMDVEPEPGVEWHAGEDAGEVPEPERDS